MSFERHQCIIIFIFIIHFAYFIVEKYFSFITHSVALEIDSYRILADGAALCVSSIVIHTATSRKEKNTYGHGRSYVLGGFTNSVFALALSLSTISHAVKRLISTEELKQPRIIVIMGGIGFAFNFTLLISLVVRRYKIRRKSKKQKNDEEDKDSVYNSLCYSSKNSRTEEKLISCQFQTKKQQAYLHELIVHEIGNNLASLGLILSGLLSIFGEGHWCHYADPLISICIISLITLTNLPLFYRTSHIMLQTLPSNIRMDDFIEQIKKMVPGVLNVHELHIWQITDNTVVATLHYVVTSHHFFASFLQIKELLQKAGIQHISIQPEICNVDEYDENSEECLLRNICNNEQCSKMVCCKLIPNDSICSSSEIEISINGQEQISETTDTQSSSII